jgi:tetratricopeptide (TPR) repeat protein
MDKQVLLGLLENPKNLTEDHLEELEEIVQKYPYFHLPHVLVARLLQEKNSSLALQKIRKASLYVYNRSLLKKFILNGASTQPINAMEEYNNQEQEPVHKKLFEDIQQEIEAFDKKIENASIEELDKELANITESYLPKDYMTEEANKATEETATDKTDTQKEQDFLIDEFLKSDIFKKDKKTAEETPQEEIDKIEEETLEENQEIKENIEKQEVMDTVQSTATIHEVTEEEALRLFNEGNTKEAIEVYEKLKDISPEKASYYQSQIDIFKMDFSTIELKEEDTLLQDFLETPIKQEETKSLENEKINIEVKEEVVEKAWDVEVKKVEEEKLTEPFEKIAEEKTPEEVKIGDEVTEQQALAYFNEGKISEAVEIYKQLMLQNPDKKAYFASQIEILES